MSFTSKILIKRRGDTILEERSENLTLTNIGFESQQNLSCAAVNEIGPGESDSLQISVFGKITFLMRMSSLRVIYLCFSSAIIPQSSAGHNERSVG